MKEERLAILSMVEKGIISVDEAERLFNTINKKPENSGACKANHIFSKTGEGISGFAKKFGTATEKLVEDSKPAFKKAGQKIGDAVEDAKPAFKKVGEKIGEVVEDTKPMIKKAANSVAEKAGEFKKNRKDEVVDDACVDDQCCCQDEVEESDFEKDVIIIPVKQEEVVVEKTEITEE